MRASAMMTAASSSPTQVQAARRLVTTSAMPGMAPMRLALGNTPRVAAARGPRWGRLEGERGAQDNRAARALESRGDGLGLWTDGTTSSSATVSPRGSPLPLSRARRGGGVYARGSGRGRPGYLLRTAGARAEEGADQAPTLIGWRAWLRPVVPHQWGDQLGQGMRRMALLGDRSAWASRGYGGPSRGWRPSAQ